MKEGRLSCALVVGLFAWWLGCAGYGSGDWEGTEEDPWALGATSDVVVFADSSHAPEDAWIDWAQYGPGEERAEPDPGAGGSGWRGPQCTGKECGDDGCGGSCGRCESNEICHTGLCLPAGLPSECLDGPLKFDDIFLDSAVRHAIDKPWGDLLIADVRGISGLQPYLGTVHSLEGIRCVFALENLQMPGQEIENLSPLAGLERLEVLHLPNNNIADLGPLASVDTLLWLEIRSNEVADLSPLASLPNLQTLDVDGNYVADLSPLAELMALEYLSAENNLVAELPPMSGLPNLGSLNLAKNLVKDISPLAEAEALTHLYLSGNQVSCLSPLAGLKSLKVLRFDWNSVDDLSPLASHTELWRISFSGNQVTDLEALSSAFLLEEVTASGNQISSLAPLAEMEWLEKVDLKDNQIADLKPLIGNKGVGTGDIVNLEGNNIDCQLQAGYIQILKDRGVKLEVSCP